LVIIFATTFVLMQLHDEDGPTPEPTMSRQSRETAKKKFHQAQVWLQIIIVSPIDIVKTVGRSKLLFSGNETVQGLL